MHKLFVYGTLRRGEVNHSLLESSKCIAYLARLPGFGIFDTGLGYPGISAASDQSDQVCGEIYELDDETLQRVDTLEGFHAPGDSRNLYERIETEAWTDQGPVKVLTYVYNVPRQEFYPDAFIRFGDWKFHRMIQSPVVPYYAYGSCMDDARFHANGVSEWFQDIVGRGRFVGGHLQFTHHAHDGGRADLVETGGEIEGVLYKIPVEALEEYLYGREGVEQQIYRPVVIPVLLDNLQVIDAVTFVVVDKEPELAPPQHYMEEIIRGAKPVVSKSYFDSLLSRFVKSFGYQMN